MPAYKLKAKRKYGDMEKGYEFIISSARTSTPDQKDIEKAIERLGFNAQAKTYRSSGNFEVTKL